MLALRAACAAIGLSLSLAASAWAASPSPSAAIGGDPRSAGQGPGLMGDPAFAILVVLAIGLIATLGTLAVGPADGRSPGLTTTWS